MRYILHVSSFVNLYVAKLLNPQLHVQEYAYKVIIVRAKKITVEMARVIVSQTIPLQSHRSECFDRCDHWFIIDTFEKLNKRIQISLVR